MGISVPYFLNGLIPEESWSLLKKIAFGDDTIEVNQTLDTIGKKIVEKCKGVPLAIRSLGGIFLTKREEREWINVLQGDFWKLCEDKDSILPVLKLSYQNLSPQQRQCFAYCSLYPKDWMFDKGELIQMWMAHGYLECSGEEQCREDVGNEFIYIFLMKSFFQDAQMNQDGDIFSFKMHDLMHDLAIQVAGSDCCYLDSKAKRCIGRPVHLSVEFDAFCLLKSMDASRLQTLIMFSSYKEKELNADELSVILNFKYLRVLKLMYSSLSKLSGSIEKLKHLRYLNLLTCRGIKILTKSIGNLVCLQTIKVKLDESVVLYSEDVSKLINLRHLEISEWICNDKIKSIGFGKLSIQQHKGMVFSKWLFSLTNITEISLTRCQGFQYLPPLERLPFLKSLQLFCLYDLEYIYYKEPILHESFFPSLEILLFWQCEKMRGWRRKTGDDFNDINSSHHLWWPQFHCLSKLAIKGCQMLTSMPSFPNIKRLLLNACSVEILEATLNIPASQYSNGFPPLSMLKYLRINAMNMDMKKAPKDWLKNLTSLKNLDFDYLSDQQLEVIEIWFKDNHKCLPSLQKITFYNCYNLKILPDWICNLSSLQHIGITSCRNLALLPEGISRLTNLCTLEIIDCPILAEECRAEVSATSTKIARIPNIIIRDWY